MSKNVVVGTIRIGSETFSGVILSEKATKRILEVLDPKNKKKRGGSGHET